jgi:mannose-6-phosphate isomerase-like protein (cupin superfamily)
MTKKEIFKKTAQLLENDGFTVVEKDLRRPWGGFFVIDGAQAHRFISAYFPGVPLSDFEGFAQLSPKFLIVGPGHRLSWQYHRRRSEIWRLLDGVAGVVISPTDEQGPVQPLAPGDLVRLPCGQRHRLVGLGGWGILAEVWQHTDPAHPSDERDIVRLQDDYGR